MRCARLTTTSLCLLALLRFLPRTAALVLLVAAMPSLPGFEGRAQSPEANYDEAKVRTYTLPDPLRLENGKGVDSPRVWRHERRPEILRLFEEYVYGHSPRPPRKLQFVETSREPRALGGLATRKEITVWLTANGVGPELNLLVYIPNQRPGPAPLFLGMNFNGNQSVNSDSGITPSAALFSEYKKHGVVDPDTVDKFRGTESSRWPIEMILKRGYAVATFYYGDLFPDRADGLRDSIIPFYFRLGQKVPNADEWGAIAAWAWGLSRAMDYFTRDPDVDGRRVAVWGHSRLGKAALWAGAQDERFALVISNDSGEGGAALARRNFGETIEIINARFPHWFCANYKKFATNVEALPVDQHMLISLIAPRPVYIASAAGDLWADPKGEFLAAKAASAVYRLLGTDGLGLNEMPSNNQPVFTMMGYHIREGKHDTTTYDWEQFLNFADRHLARLKK